MLAKDWTQRKPSYDFVIVGSGYGGAITAARLSAAPSKPSVCVLERGREWQVGEFPDKLADVLKHRNDRNLNPTGLYEFLTYPEITVLKGCGLGGTSLINANVAIQPDDETFQQSAWPRQLNAAMLQPFYDKARGVLAAVPHPRSNPAQATCLRKVSGLDRRAQELSQRAYGLNIAVNHTIDGVNPHGVAQKPCTDCGDCVTGCNVGAKNTLAMNYLPIAQRNGAHIFPKCEVKHVEKLSNGGWRIHGRRFDGAFPDDFKIEAKNVILSGGSLGTTEILLRSEKKGLKLSPKVGQQFSGNGDFFALAYNADHQLNTMGFGKDAAHPWKARGNAPGPSIVGAVKYDKNLPLSQRILVEDFSFPKAYVAGARFAFDAASVLGLAQDTDTGDEAQERARRERPPLPDPYQFNDNSLNHTMLYLIMGHDDARGSMRLKRGFPDFQERLEIDWDNIGRQPVFDLINAEINRHSRALGASFLTNPLWQFTRDRNLITAHPLGGCPVGEDYLHGAVDPYGRVFAGDGQVHEGLFVADGSLIPTALGVNPFLTISALSENIADRMVRKLNGEAYPAPAKAVSMARLNPQEVITYKEVELERLFTRSGATQPAATMVNSGTASYDAATRTIRNDHVWKGFFPRGHILNQFSTAFHTSFRKRFSLENGKIIGLTSGTDNFPRAKNTIEEINIEKREGTLEPGKYILLRYTEPQWRGFYDVFKKVSDDLMIGRVYLGDYPNGHRLFTFPMTRSYGLDNITVADHRALYAQSTAPTKAQLHGVWEMRAVSNAAQTGTIAYLKFDHKPDGTLQANYQFLGLLEGLAEPVFGQDHFRLNDFTRFHDEIRLLDADTMVGKYLTATPPVLANLFGDQSLGLLQNEKGADGTAQFGFYYVLRRSSLADTPPVGFLRPLLEIRLPSGIGLSFDEEMDGRYFAGLSLPAGRAGDLTLDAKGPNDGVAISFAARITARDINEFCASPEHEASIGGKLHFGDWQGRGARAFEIKESKSFFNYLRVNAATGEAEMLYRLYFNDDTGREHLLHGRKYLQKDASGMAEVMRDFTTLYVHLTDQTTGKELGVARLHFRLFENLAAAASFARYLTSFRVIGTDNLFIQAQAQLRYLALTNQFIAREYDILSFLQ